VSTTNGISGTAVAVATFGAVLVYAGLRGVSPLQALRDAASGKPPAVESRSTQLPIISQSSGFGDAKRSSVVAAAQKYVGDTYSQLKRREPGYSDCSSFVDKALRDAGIDPPFGPWANTANFRMSPEWKTVPASQVWPGDIALSAAHMVLVTARGGTTGIGQQRPGVNVRTGTMATLFGSQRYVFKTWTGYSPNPGAGQGSGGTGKDQKSGGSW
jgi:hypothetical protein